MNFDKSTTTPRRGGLNGDPKRVFEKALFTAETRRTQSLVFVLFSFDPAEKRGTFRTQENKSQNALRRHRMLFTSEFLLALPRFSLSSRCKIFSFLASHQKRKHNFSHRTLRLERSPADFYGAGAR